MSKIALKAKIASKFPPFCAGKLTSPFCNLAEFGKIVQESSKRELFWRFFAYF
jgi:hypothetical protein